ncbi:MAG TPA: Clp protease N-terminal domain-containing protein [Solirubrobacteraceae bacterium]|nr:Clp protease N-terminal domain-containing protein [Solirubrobacteraceae bacterium]
MGSVPSLEELMGDLPPGSPIERLTAASLLAQRLHARGDELLDQLVDAARAQGASWTEIGGALQTTKQAAQQRFAVVAQEPAGDSPFGLTGAAADALAAAANEARELGHHYVRPEHLVLGLLALPEEMAARALASEGVSLEDVREHVRLRLGSAEPRPTGSLGVAPQTKRLLELARAIGKSLCHQCPRTEHVLLAAVSPKLHSPAATLLAECGTEPAEIREQVMRMVLEQSPELAGALHRQSWLSRLTSTRR